MKMLFLTLVGLLTATCVLATPIINKRQAATANVTLDLSAQLRLANTDVERVSLLANAGGNESFVFDFAHAPANSGPPSSAGGSVITAFGSTFPALINRNIGAAVFILNACSLVPPHTHPRSAEFITVVEGTVFTQFLTESGSVVISNNLTTLMGTVFPQGSIHLEFNPTCGKAVFVAGFNDDDPGVSNVAANFLAFDQELVGASLGGDKVVSAADLASFERGLPQDAVFAVQECVSRCGIKPNRKRSLREILAEE